MLKTQINTVIKPFAALVALTVLLAGQSVLAQDNTQGRYRPDGRQIAAEISRMFGERLYEVRTYDPQPRVDEFADATIFYPLTLSFAPPIGAVAVVPGYRGAAENYEWWGPMLASFGYAVLIMNTNTPEDNLEARKQALMTAAEFLRNENTESDSPIAGRIDTGKIAIMGHSLGGGAALQAASELGSDGVGAVIPLLPYCCELGQSFSGDLASLNVPTLIMATAEDSIAPPAQHARLLYDAIADSTSRVYMEFAEGDHMMATSSGQDLVTMGRYAMAFLKFHLDSQPQYEAVIYGGEAGDYEGKFSRFDASR
jgi:triacylglycerol lipase